MRVYTTTFGLFVFFPYLIRRVFLYSRITGACPEQQWTMTARSKSRFLQLLVIAL